MQIIAAICLIWIIYVCVICIRRQRIFYYGSIDYIENELQPHSFVENEKWAALANIFASDIRNPSIFEKTEKIKNIYGYLKQLKNIQFIKLRSKKYV
jgi:hypothetical protein